jgi:hypothetical protein
MRGPSLATAIVAVHQFLDFRPSDQPLLAARPADNDNTTVAVELSATPVSRDWRSTRAGSIVHWLVPLLVILGALLTVAWTATLAWAVFRIFLWWYG